MLINFAMFAAAFGGGLVARSSALMADSVDMFGDAIVYAQSMGAGGSSFVLLGRPAATRRIHCERLSARAASDERPMLRKASEARSNAKESL